MNAEKVIKKKRRVLKTTTIIFIPLGVLVATLVIFWHASGRPSLGRKEGIAPPITIDTSGFSGFAADALYMVQTIEQTHPIFIVERWLPYNYEIERDRFLQYANNPHITKTEFAFAAQRYITMLRDGHMSGMVLVEYENQLTRLVGGRTLGGTIDVPWVAQDGQLLWLGDNYIISDTFVVDIGGVPASQILATIDTYFYAENEADRNNNHTTFSRSGDIIQRAGGDISDRWVRITLQNDNDITNIFAELSFETVSRNEHDFIIRHEMLEDIFFIDLRIFIDGDHISEVVTAIEEAVTNGTHKFIVDLRGNGGGNSMAGQRLLEAMGLTVPRFGAVHRISTLPIEQHSLWHFRLLRRLGFSYSRTAPSISGISNPNNVFISVLTDVDTFSSANMMGVWVQDGGFGNVIGSASRQAPTNFGDVLWYTLPYSGIYTLVSFVQWLRPDENANPFTLQPDIVVDPAYALEVAIQYLRK